MGGPVAGLTVFPTPLQLSRLDDAPAQAVAPGRADAVGAVSRRYDRPEPARSRPPARQKRRTPPVAPGTRGELRIVPGASEIVGQGPLVRFAVEVEGRLQVKPAAFARTVERVLGDSRGWGGARSFQRVDSEPFDARVALASPALTDRLCLPLLTNGIFSCAAGNRAVLNLGRWRRGADAYGDDLSRYRIYMINHEVGHVLGLGHTACPAGGAKAPVMMQQTKGVAPCTPNPWPLASERQ